MRLETLNKYLESLFGLWGANSDGERRARPPRKSVSMRYARWASLYLYNCVNGKSYEVIKYVSTNWADPCQCDRERSRVNRRLWLSLRPFMFYVVAWTPCSPSSQDLPHDFGLNILSDDPYSTQCINPINLLGLNSLSLEQLSLSLKQCMSYNGYLITFGGWIKKKYWPYILSPRSSFSIYLFSDDTNYSPSPRGIWKTSSLSLTGRGGTGSGIYISKSCLFSYTAERSGHCNFRTESVFLI